MKKIKVENAVGSVLAHDVTRIIPGEFKGVAFQKGHIIQDRDIAELKKIGKNHLFVLALTPDRLHEDDAAVRICAAICGGQVNWSPPVEGKSSIRAQADGLLKIDVDALMRINDLDDIIVSTLKNNSPCTKDQIVAATRIVPLTTRLARIEHLEAIAGAAGPILNVRPFQPFKIGAVVTGTEVYQGVIHDGFDEFVKPTIIRYGSEVVEKKIVPDDARAVADAIGHLVQIGCDLVVTTGGLSVDPDDVTKAGVMEAGARLVAYGAPVLPGAMFLYALYEDVPILGLPACVYYHQVTIFNLLLPRILVGETLSRADITAMGHGGLCLDCAECRYPVCPFGK